VGFSRATFPVPLIRNDAVGIGERARPGRSGPRPRGPWEAQETIHRLLCPDASVSDAGRAGQQPGRLRSPFISTASFRPIRPSPTHAPSDGERVKERVFLTIDLSLCLIIPFGNPRFGWVYSCHKRQHGTDLSFSRIAFMKSKKSCAAFIAGSLFVGGFLLGCMENIKNEKFMALYNDEVKCIERNIDSYGDRLHIGMSRRDVLAILQRPLNTNSENVCIWVSEPTDSVANQNHKDWR
jgi:hypothetical protein